MMIDGSSERTRSLSIGADYHHTNDDLGATKETLDMDQIAVSWYLFSLSHADHDENHLYRHP